MTRNPILEELYQARADILNEHQGDLSAYLRDAQRRLVASGHPIADIKQRSIQRIAPTDSSDLTSENPIASPSDQ